MTNLIRIALLVILCWSCLSMAHHPIRACVDNRYWYPFAFQEENQLKGLFVEMAVEAINQANHQVEVIAVPMKRCIKVLAKIGKVDAAVGVTFSPSLNQNMTFPPEADHQESVSRLMQVDFNLVTPINSSYDYNGELQGIPQPIRVPKTYTNIISYLESMAITVETSKQDESSFYKMLRDQNGSLITTSIMADRFSESPRFSDQFVVHPLPIASQSYFLAFFQGAKTPPNQQTIVWEKVTALRNDYIYMLQLLSKY